MIKFIIIAIIVLMIIYGIVSGIKYAFENHYVISSTVVIGILSLILKNILVFIICEIILLVVALCIRQYVKARDAEIARQMEEQRRQDIEKIRQWTEAGRDIHIDLREILIKLVDNLSSGYYGYYNYNNMPYGRAEAFTGNFTHESQNDNEYYFFKPERTMDTCSIRENGLLIAKSGIYIIYESKDSNNNVHLHKYSLEYKNLWGFTIDQTTKVIDTMVVINHTGDGFNTLFASDFGINKVLDDFIKALFRNKIPQYARYYGISDEILYLDVNKDDVSESEEKDNNKGDNIIYLSDIRDGQNGKTRPEYYGDTSGAENNLKKNVNYDSLKKATEMSGVIGGAAARTGIYNEVKNTMDGSQGHGYAAEYGNNTIDRLLGKDVKNVGVGNAKNGADRCVNGQMIQTKYCKNFDTLWANAFPDGEVRYIDNGKPMTIEVPRDKYADCCHKLQQKIDSGQLDGVEPGTRADSILKKGFFTYEAAQNIAVAGTIEGLTVDVFNGVITSVYPTAISAVITFAIAIWQGKDTKEAAEAALEVGVRIMGRSILIYTATMQLTRANIAVPFMTETLSNPVKQLSSKMVSNIRNSQLANTYIGEKMGLRKMTESVLMSNVVTAVVVFGPDICSFFSGKISGKQLFKNSAVGAGGLAGAAVGAAIAGPLGAVAGGILSSTVTKKTLDKYIEDDAIAMFYIFKQEYIDIIMQSCLSNDDIEKVANRTLCMECKQLQKFLKNMYAASSSRQYAADYISGEIKTILRNKKNVNEDDYNNGCQKYLIANNVAV